MTVNIIISDQSGGNALADNVDLGSVTPDNETSIQDLYIRHDANVNDITDCALYVTRFSLTGYLGEDADEDFAEIIGWGDENEGYGFVINQNAASGLPQFPEVDDQICKTGAGDINGQLELVQSAINIGSVTEDGVIPLGGEAHIQVRAKVPPTVPAGANYRGIQLVMAYSATS